MSDLNELKVGRVKGKGILQYVSDIMNNPNLDIKDTMSGIKAISIADRRIQEAILAAKAKEENLTFDNIDRTSIVDGEEMKKTVDEGLFREIGE